MGTAFPPAVTPYLPLIYVHITGGVIAMLAGYTAVLAAKGEPSIARPARFSSCHADHGGMATYLPSVARNVMPGQRPTAARDTGTLPRGPPGWRTAKDRRTRPFRADRAAAVLGLAAVFLDWGVKASMSHRTAPSTVIADVLLFLSPDSRRPVRRLISSHRERRRDRSGAHRAASVAHVLRVLLRAGSFFLGQQKVMPEWMHGAWYLYVLGLAPLAFMIFWLIRVRIGNRFKTAPTSGLRA